MRKPSVTDHSRWLRDLEEIKMSKHLYGDIVDHLPQTGEAGIEELCKLFTADAALDFTELFGRTLHGHDDIREQFRLLAADRAWMWHSFTNPVIEITGDAARSRWVIHAKSTGRADANGAPDLIYGRYADEYVRTAHGWKQSKLKMVNETRGR
jgi:hypothetical protein